MITEKTKQQQTTCNLDDLKVAPAKASTSTNNSHIHAAFAGLVLAALAGLAVSTLGGEEASGDAWTLIDLGPEPNKYSKGFELSTNGKGRYRYHNDAQQVTWEANIDINSLGYPVATAIDAEWGGLSVHISALNTCTCGDCYDENDTAVANSLCLDETNMDVMDLADIVTDSMRNILQRLVNKAAKEAAIPGLAKDVVIYESKQHSLKYNYASMIYKSAEEPLTISGTFYSHASNSVVSHSPVVVNVNDVEYTLVGISNCPCCECKVENKKAFATAALPAELISTLEQTFMKLRLPQWRLDSSPSKINVTAADGFKVLSYIENDITLQGILFKNNGPGVVTDLAVSMPHAAFALGAWELCTCDICKNKNIDRLLKAKVSVDTVYLVARATSALLLRAMDT